MFCNQCGKPIPDLSLFCPSCGKRIVLTGEADQPNQSSLGPKPPPLTPPLTHLLAHSKATTPKPKEKRGLSVFQKLGIIIFALGTIGILISLYEAQESVYLEGMLTGGFGHDFTAIYNGGPISILIAIVGISFVGIPFLRKPDLLANCPPPITEQEPLKKEVTCWNCKYYQSSWYDNATGTCNHNNNKTHYWKTCEHHESKTTF